MPIVGYFHLCLGLISPMLSRSMESSFPEPSQPATAALLPLRNSAFTWVGYSLLMALLTIVFFADVRHHLLGLDDANMFADNLAFDRDFANFFISRQECSLGSALRVVARDSAAYGLRGVFRGQGIGIIKAIISLTMFHQGRIFLTEHFKDRNRRLSAPSVPGVI